jgi:hypothetical protein
MDNTINYKTIEIDRRMIEKIRIYEKKLITDSYFKNAKKKTQRRKLKFSFSYFFYIL